MRVIHSQVHGEGKRVVHAAKKSYSSLDWLLCQIYSSASNSMNGGRGQNYVHGNLPSWKGVLEFQSTLVPYVIDHITRGLILSLSSHNV